MATRGSWQPGQSGNPNGRPAEYAEVRAELRANLRVALAKLLGLLESDEPESQRFAIKMLFEYALPKPAPEQPQQSGNRLDALVDLLRQKQGPPA